MTNRIAVFLGIVILAVIAANFIFGWELHIFWGRKLADLIHWLAFWH